MQHGPFNLLMRGADGKVRELTDGEAQAVKQTDPNAPTETE